MDGPGPDLTIIATPKSVGSLATGALSLVMHAGHDQTDKMAAFHLLQGKQVRLEIYVEEG